MRKPPAIKGKVLTFGHLYVDIQQLYRGIYGTDIPYVYPPEETKESVSANLEQALGRDHDMVIAFRTNVDQCEWTNVTIKPD